MPTPDEIKEEIRARADLVAVVGRFVPLKKRGNQWIGRCPFHDDHSPSLYVTPHLGIYKCFVCGAGGDVFRFLMEHEKISFPEALELLANETGVPLPKTQADTGPMIRTQKIRETLEWAVRFYHDRFNATPQVREYALRRGFTEDECREFRLGFAPDSYTALQQAAREAGLGAEQLEEAGLALRTERGDRADRFRCRLMFPLLDLSRRPVAFAGRKLKSTDPSPKYLNSPELPIYRKSEFLFGLGHARTEIAKSESAILVEGYMDWHALWRHGFKNAVAVSGTAFTADQARLLARYARRVICLFDGDKAGAAAAERSLPVLLAAGLQPLFLPLGVPGEPGAPKDPDEFLRSRGAEAFRAQFARAHSWIQHLSDRFLQDHPFPRPEDKRQLIVRIEELIASIPDPLVQAEYRKLAADKLVALEIDVGALARALEGKPASPQSARAPLPAAARHPQAARVRTPKWTPPLRLKGRSRAEAGFLYSLIRHPALCLDLPGHIHPSEIQQPEVRVVLDELLAQADGAAIPEPKTLSSHLDEDVRDFLDALSGTFEANLDEIAARQTVSDFLADRRSERLREKRRRLAALVRSREEDSAREMLQDFASLLRLEQPGPEQPRQEQPAMPDEPGEPGQSQSHSNQEET